MEQQEILDQLLDEWEQGVMAGRPKPLESICRDNAELLAALKEQAAKLAAVDNQLWIGLESSRNIRAERKRADVSIPKQLGGYELLDEIGRGGMGVVYRATQLAAERIVALKVIRPDRLSSFTPDERERAISRFRTEALAAARLTNDHMVTVYDVGEADGHPYYSMRHIEGRSLAALLDDGPMAANEAAEYLAGVCEAVHEAHCKGILHRDIKPQNILVDEEADRALVADFGLAKLAEGERQLSEAGEIFGTPSYMSPEQARDSASVTAASDIYALGAVFYECLTGRPPFRAKDRWATINQVIEAEPAAPRVVNPAVDRDAETIALKCLEKEPSRRYESAAALTDDLGRYIRGEPISARPIGRPARVYRWCRRKPAMAAMAGLSLCLAACMVVAAVAWAYREIGHAMELRENLAEANVLAARTEGQRGRWAQSLELLDEAIALGHPDPTAVELKRVEALDALGSTEERAALLGRLLSDPSLVEHRPEVLLRSADVARLEGDSEKPRQFIDEALKLGLDDADAEYARAQIAETTPKAIEHLRAAIRIDGFHYRANLNLLFLLLIQGEIREAEAQAESIGSLYPDDPRIEVLRAGAQIADGREAEARELLDSLVGMNRLRDGEMPVIEAAFGALKEFREIDLTEPGTAARAVLLKAIPILPRVHALQQDAGGGGPVSQAPQLLAMAPPSVRNAWSTVLSVATPSFSITSLFGKKSGHQAQIDKLAAAAEAHPDALILFMQAHLLDQDGRVEEAERVAVEASNAPSIAKHAKSAALSFAAGMAAVQYLKTKDDAVIARAASHVRGRMDAGPLVSPSEQYLMVKIALRAKNYELANRVVDEIRAHSSDDTGWKAWKGQIALDQGHFVEAMQLAEEVLKAAPDNEMARGLLGKATDGLNHFVDKRKAVEVLSPSPSENDEATVDGDDG